MLVAHQNDHITHAVIGGKKSINFGISDDPAFFQILSSALYKNPMLAMVRETICNAWDAHIESGRTDQPIIVTLDDDYLIIRDFGNGIPDDLIGPIYGVYGASTKKNDGRQTGGFGLGCKSPFAYTDHFEVTSHHAGTKTIYSMSKSSAQVAGKPSIVPIASFPTTESGIIVKIPLNPEKQNFSLGKMVREVVFNGDIKAMFNKELLPVLGLDDSECGLTLINDFNEDNNLTGHLSNKHRIYVRYGNVIYPIERSEEFGALFDKVASLLASYYACRLVMLAPSDSISMTPSRESLTMSDITTQTITDLLSKFLAIFYKNQELMVRHKNMVKDYVEVASKENIPFIAKIDPINWRIPGVPANSSEPLLSSKEQFAMLEVMLRYSGRRGSIRAKTWLAYISQFYYGMVGNQFDRGLFQSWHRTATRYVKTLKEPGQNRHYRGSRETRIATRWWQQRIMLPLVQKLQEALPDFQRSSLSYCSNNLQNHNYSEPTPRSLKHVSLDSHTGNLVHLLKPTIIVSHNTEHLVRRMKFLTIDKRGTGTLLKGSYFAYQIGRKKDEVEKTLAQLNSIAGIEVIDLTGRMTHEENAYQERQEQIAKARAAIAAGKTVVGTIAKKVRPGLVTLAFITDSANHRIDTRILAESHDPVRIVEPEFIEMVSTGKDHRHTSLNFSSNVLYAASKLYGDKGAVTNRSDVYERYLAEKKSVKLSDYLFDKIVKDIETSPTLLAYHACDPDKINDYLVEKTDWHHRSNVVDLVYMLLNNSEFKDLIPQMDVLSEEDSYRWTIWKNIEQFRNRDQRDQMKALQDKVYAIPLKPEIIQFLDKLIGNEFLGLIDSEDTGKLLRKHRQDPAIVAKIVSFITTILS